MKLVYSGTSGPILRQNKMPELCGVATCGKEPENEPLKMIKTENVGN